MTNNVTPEERLAAQKHLITDDQYIAKRAFYCAQQGTSVTALSELSSQDLAVCRATGTDVGQYHKTKLAMLAETVISNT